MAGVDEIVVTGHPQNVDSGNIGTPSGVQTVQAQVTQIAGSYQTRTSVTEAPGATGPDIVVIANKLKNAMTEMYVNFALGSNYTINFPCVGAINRSEIASILWNMTFNITTINYGPGRAGQNDVGIGNSAVPVGINQDSLRGYDALPGGLDYLVMHETAHALKVMQDYDLAMWTSYINGPGKNLSDADRKAQYPTSDQFKQNEARANTVARAINQYRNKAAWNWTPTNDYQIC